MNQPTEFSVRILCFDGTGREEAGYMNQPTGYSAGQYVEMEPKERRRGIFAVTATSLRRLVKGTN